METTPESLQAELDRPTLDNIPRNGKILFLESFVRDGEWIHSVMVIGKKKDGTYAQWTGTANTPINAKSVDELATTMRAHINKQNERTDISDYSMRVLDILDPYAIAAEMGD